MKHRFFKYNKPYDLNLQTSFKNLFNGIGKILNLIVGISRKNLNEERSNKINEDGKCVEKCPTRSVGALGKCNSCSQTNCANCRPQNLQYCENCVKPLVSDKGICVPICPEGTFRKGSKCTNCHPACKNCAKLDACITCKPQFTLSKGLCLSGCQPGYVKVLSTCIACQDTNCLVCSSNDINQCHKCAPGTSLFQNECITKCPIRYTLNTTFNICTPCSKYCDACTLTTCTKCTPGFFTLEKKCLN